MTAYEAVILFKNDCEKAGWERIVRRYNGRNVSTLVRHIAITYGIMRKADVEKALRQEFEKTLNEMTVNAQNI